MAVMIANADISVVTKIPLNGTYKKSLANVLAILKHSILIMKQQ